MGPVASSGLAGVALIDVSGHQATDATLAAMFHQAFLLGILYELDMSGHLTTGCSRT